MSVRRSLYSLSLRILSMATLLGLGMPSCSSDDSGAGGSGGDGSTPGADSGGPDGGGTDATTRIDGTAGGDSGGPDGATGDGGGVPGDGSGNEAGNDSGSDAADTGTQAMADVYTPPPILCPIETPLTTSIVDFMPQFPTSSYSWGDFNTGFSGYTYYYSSADLVSQVSGGTWHLTGNVADYCGFGLGFACMVDASAYAGVAFTIQGNAGALSQLTFSVTTAADDIIDPNNPSYARCTPAMNPYDGTCAEPRVIIDVPATATTVSLRWQDLLAGRPSPVNPAEITRITWAFAWPATAADGSPNGYPIDVTISNMAFIRNGSSSDAASDVATSDGSGDATSSEASVDGASTDSASTDGAPADGASTDSASTDGASGDDGASSADAPSE